MAAPRYTGIKFTGPHGHTRVYWDADWRQYVCKFWQYGSRHPEGDYYTDDLDDAEQSARRMVQEERSLP